MSTRGWVTGLLFSCLAWPLVAAAGPAGRDESRETRLALKSEACSGVAGGWDRCTEHCLCGEGMGDCDSDEDCGAGLYCTRDMGAFFGWDQEVDVCLPRCPGIGAGGWSFCSAQCPCYQGEGDCDGDEECMPGLVCVRDVGASYGWDQEVDVCLDANPDARATGARH